MNSINDVIMKEIMAMRKFLSLIFAWGVALAVHAQDMPYSKYLNFSKEQFKENNFKYHKKANAWTLSKVNGLNETLNILAIIADAGEEVRPAVNDYYIVAQLGQEEQVASVEVEFYNDDTYHKLLTFLKDNGQDLVETSSGKLIKHQAYYGGYAVAEDINIDGLEDVTLDTIKELLTVDVENWKSEAEGIESFYGELTRVPSELYDELAKLKANLNK